MTFVVFPSNATEIRLVGGSNISFRSFDDTACNGIGYHSSQAAYVSKTKPLSMYRYKSKKQVEMTLEFSRAAVYLLIDLNEIVYVGESLKPLQRIGQHVKGKIFNSYRIMYCRPERRLYWEKKLIDAFQPLYNVKGKRRRG